MTPKEHDKIWNTAVNNTVKCVLDILDDHYTGTCNRYSKIGYMEAARDEIRRITVAVKGLQV